MHIRSVRASSITIGTGLLLAAAVLLAGAMLSRSGNAGAQEAAVAPGKISVTGSATATATPDRSRIDLSVSVLADTAAEAIAQANAAANRVVTAVRSVGVAAADLQTTGISLNAEYDWRESGRVLLGYRFRNALAVTVRDIDTTGAILDAATAAGGDPLSVDGIQFTVSNTAALEASVRLAAIDDALAKAQAMTERAGVTLGRAVLIQEAGGATPLPFQAAPTADGVLATPVFTGTQEITLSVYLEFETF